MKVFQIPVPTPFPVGCINAYLIASNVLTLVDCGPSTEEAWTALEAGVEKAGYHISQVRRLILTHAHIDHFGLAHRVQRASGCEVFAHPVDHAILLDLPGALQDIVNFLTEACRRAGVPTPYLRDLEQGLADRYRRYTRPVQARGLVEGDRLLFPEGMMHVLHTPGHSRGSICLWDASKSLLISGDTLIPHISSNAIMEPGAEQFRTKSLLVYKQTLTRISTMMASRVLPGHGSIMGSPDSVITKRIDLSNHRADQIYRVFKKGADSPWAIASELFPVTKGSYVYLPVSEVVGHLDLLSSRGALRFEGADDPWKVYTNPPQDHNHTSLKGRS